MNTTQAQRDEVIEAGGKATERPWEDAGNKIGADDHGIAEVDFDHDEDRQYAILSANLAVPLAQDVTTLRALLARVKKAWEDGDDLLSFMEGIEETLK